MFILHQKFRYQDPILGKRDLVILISQSGETADTVQQLRLAKERGARTLAVVNVVGSTVAREADHIILTLAGPEISVASTKAYSSQIAVMYAVSIKIAKLRGKISSAEAQALLEELRGNVPAAIEEIIGQKGKDPEIGRRIFTMSECVLYRERAGLPSGVRRIAEIKRNYVYPQRSLCCGRNETWHDFANQRWHASDCACYK